MTPTAKILLLGSGELGREFTISAKRLGDLDAVSPAKPPPSGDLRGDFRALYDAWFEDVSPFEELALKPPFEQLLNKTSVSDENTINIEKPSN